MLTYFLVSYKQQSVPLDDQDLSVILVIPFLGIKSLKSLSSIGSLYFIGIIDRLPSEGFLLWGLRILEAKVEEWKVWVLHVGHWIDEEQGHSSLHPSVPDLCFGCFVFNLLCLLYHSIVLDLGWNPQPGFWCSILAASPLQPCTSTMYSKCCSNALLDQQSQGSTIGNWTSGSCVHLLTVTCPLLYCGSLGLRWCYTPWCPGRLNILQLCQFSVGRKGKFISRMCGHSSKERPLPFPGSKGTMRSIGHQLLYGLLERWFS